MPLDPGVKRFLDLLAASNPAGALHQTVPARRAGLEALMKFGGPVPRIGAVEERSIPGPAGPLPTRIYTPLERHGVLPGLVYFHGGGLVAGSIATHDSIARALANDAACRVVSVDYRLAPESPFPAAVDDALAAVCHVSARAAEFGIDAARIGICGDSAGGALAVATSLALSGTALLALQVLICPVLDYGRTTSWHAPAPGYLLDQATLEHDLRHYLPSGADPADPRVSPLRSPRLAGLPRTLIHTAEFDPLRDEGRELFERLSNAGGKVSYTCHAGMIHLFYALGSVAPAAHAAFRQIGAEIRTAFEA